MRPTQTLGPDQLNPVVQREGAQLQRCWESALKHGKAPAGPAVLTVQLTVGRDGTVDNVLFDAADFGGLHPCLERTLRRLRFPRSAGTTEFAVPLELDPGG